MRDSAPPRRHSAPRQFNSTLFSRTRPRPWAPDYIKLRIRARGRKTIHGGWKADRLGSERLLAEVSLD